MKRKPPREVSPAIVDRCLRVLEEHLVVAFWGWGILVQLKPKTRCVYIVRVVEYERVVLKAEVNIKTNKVRVLVDLYSIGLNPFRAKRWTRGKAD